MEEQADTNEQNNKSSCETKSNECAVNKIKTVLDDKTTKICLSVFLATLAGSFAATYFVTDKYMAHKFEHPKFNTYISERDFFNDFNKNPFKEFDDFHKFQEREYNKFFPKNNIRPGIKGDIANFKPVVSPFLTPPVKIKTENDDGNYNIIVSLKPFQNNPDKVNYEVKENLITVYGKSDTVDDNVTSSVSFSQDFIIPGNTDKSGIKKIHDGDKLIISLPERK